MQERLELLFETFVKLRAVAKVMREFNDRGLALPRRDRRGDLHWAQSDNICRRCDLEEPRLCGCIRVRTNAVTQIL